MYSMQTHNFVSNTWVYTPIDSIWVKGGIRSRDAVQRVLTVRRITLAGIEVRVRDVRSFVTPWVFGGLGCSKP